MCGPHRVWPLRSECCGRGVPTKVVCAECMKMCCLGGKNSVVKGLKVGVHKILDMSIKVSSMIIHDKDANKLKEPKWLLLSTLRVTNSNSLAMSSKFKASVISLCT